MPRLARVVLEGLPYHVTQRGNGRQQVFFAHTDYELYLDLAFKHARAARLRVWAYCLMPNHVHWVVVPDQPLSLAKAMRATHAEYARYFNLRQRSCGHVWQARYHSCPLQGMHVWRAVAYVERNPVRACMVEQAGKYRWSSAPSRLAGCDPSGRLDLDSWRRDYTPEQWEWALATSVDEEEFRRRIVEATRRGRPLGGTAFVEELEARTGRRLKPMAPGRPRKKVAESQDEQKALAFEMGN